MKIRVKHIAGVFKALTGKNWLNSIQSQSYGFSILHFYAKCRGNDKAWRPRDKAALLPAINTLSLPLRSAFYAAMQAFLLKLAGKKLYF